MRCDKPANYWFSIAHNVWSQSGPNNRRPMNVGSVCRSAADNDRMSGVVELRVYAELNDFLHPDARYAAQLRPFRTHQTVKDVVEAAGIPHTEIDLILVNGESATFVLMKTCSQRNCSERLRINAPGKSPASHKI